MSSPAELLENVDVDNLVMGEPEDFDDAAATQTPEGGVKYGDPGWNDFVISKFEEGELYDEKYPTLNGLRRVAENLLGQVVSSRIVELKSSLDHTSEGRAYCTYEISIFNFLGSRLYRTFSGAGGSYLGNTDKTYAIYPEAIAEARAEARAYRKALMLTVASADEIKGMERSTFESVIPSVKQEYDENDDMSPTQVVTIQTKCKKLKIDVDKLIAETKAELKKDKLSRLDATNLMQKVNSYQNKTAEIPEGIKL